MAAIPKICKNEKIIYLYIIFHKSIPVCILTKASRMFSVKIGMIGTPASKAMAVNLPMFLFSFFKKQICICINKVGYLCFCLLLLTIFRRFSIKFHKCQNMSIYLYQWLQSDLSYTFVLSRTYPVLQNIYTILKSKHW